MKKITIAIDGFSSTGKSTLAKKLAKALTYIYVDTGAMYRAVTWYAMQHHYISSQHFKIQQLLADLPQIKLQFIFNETLGFAEMYVNGENVENEIRTLEVSNFVSQVAEVSQVRQMLVAQQKELGKEKGVVMDGRDIGTVVFPEAELKIFMTASAEIRAQRRYQELKNKGIQVTFEDVFRNVTERDLIDTQRKDSPLVKAQDAVELDNSQLTEIEQFDVVLKLAHQKIEQSHLQ